MSTINLNLVHVNAWEIRVGVETVAIVKVGQLMM